MQAILLSGLSLADASRISEFVSLHLQMTSEPCDRSGIRDQINSFPKYSPVRMVWSSTSLGGLHTPKLRSHSISGVSTQSSMQ